MIKRLALLTFGVILGVFTLSVLSPQEALANGPVCYVRHKDAGGQVTTTRPDCNTGPPNFDAYLKLTYGPDSKLEQDKCYIVEEGVAGITHGDPQGQELCNKAEDARSDKNSPASTGGTTTPTSTGSGGSGGTQQSGATAPQGPTADQIKNAQVHVENPDREAIRNCDGTQNPADCLKKNPLLQKIAGLFDVLSALVGVAVVGSIIMGGIQWSASAGDPNGVAKARKRITNAVIAFIAYLFLYGFVQWVIPGGVF